MHTPPTPLHIFCTDFQLKNIINECLDAKLGTGTFDTKSKEPTVLKLKPAADFLCISQHTLRKHAKNKLIKCHNPEIRGYRFLRSELEKYSKYYHKK